MLLIYPLIITNAEENEGLILREKVVARISGIAAKLDGVMGLAVKDLTTGEEFLLNHNLVFPQGSSIKVAILLEVFKQAKEGKFSLQDRLWLEKKDKVGGSGILKELGNHTVSLTIKDIAILMILLSDNTATNILIDLVGMENVNRTLSELGLTETRLQRKMMDYRAAAEERENISTPMEMLKLLEFIYRSEVLDPSSCDAILDILKRRKSGSIRQLLPSGIEVAHKPGGIEGVACDIGVVYLPHRPYIICAMTNYLIN
ncbi:MAG: class A beta-lactamase-related serine hydrolase, partial [Candidatus Aminicenantes bacterium]|nr:class A beta-lactamase-related serine hydrolase [Candidatus Aminicenantes bacterium]